MNTWHSQSRYEKLSLRFRSDTFFAQFEITPGASAVLVSVSPKKNPLNGTLVKMYAAGNPKWGLPSEPRTRTRTHDHGIKCNTSWGGFLHRNCTWPKVTNFWISTSNPLDVVAFIQRVQRFSKHRVCDINAWTHGCGINCNILRYSARMAGVPKHVGIFVVWNMTFGHLFSIQVRRFV